MARNFLGTMATAMAPATSKLKQLKRARPASSSRRKEILSIARMLIAASFLEVRGKTIRATLKLGAAQDRLDKLMAPPPAN